MTTARLLAVLLIIIGGIVLAITSARLIPALIPAVAVAGLFLRCRFRVSHRLEVWLSLLGALLLIVALIGLRGLLPDDSSRTNQDAVLYVGCYLLAVQTAMLFAAREDDCPAIVLPGLGILVILCAAVQPMETRQESNFRALVVGYVMLAGLMFMSTRKRGNHAASPRQMWFRRATVGVLLAVLTIAAWASAKPFDDLLDDFWWNTLQGSRTQRSGFSGNGDLAAVSYIRLELSDEVQLRVQSPTRPGYLRGQAFTRFDGWEWQSRSNPETLYPLPKWPISVQSANKSEKLFGRADAVATVWREYSCQPVDHEGWVFTPLGTTHVIATSPSVQIDEQDVFLADRWEEGQSYRALVPFPAAESPLNEQTRHRLVGGLPRSLSPELDALAATVMAGCTSTSEKVSAVQSYFRTNYEYQLEHDWDTDEEDALRYFLRERPPASCEFFATSAALLLRRAGVPCLYVTGYVVAEPDMSRGRWLARGRHAHAWVEAYDDEKGWVIVEATPSDGVPSSDEPSATGSVKPGEWWSEWIAGITWTVALATVVLVAGIVLLIVLRRARKRKKPRYEFQQQHDPLFSALHTLLREMDRYLRRFQLQRGSSETLHDFAQRVLRQAAEEPRLLAAAQWYPIYAACRYDGDLDDETIGVLRERLHAAQNRRIAPTRIPQRFETACSQIHPAEMILSVRR